MHGPDFAGLVSHAACRYCQLGRRVLGKAEDVKDSCNDHSMNCKRNQGAVIKRMGGLIGETWAESKIK